MIGIGENFTMKKIQLFLSCWNLVNFQNCSNGSSLKKLQQIFERIKEELADVLIYSMMLADNLQLDIEQIIEEKLEKNKAKYPVKLSKGNNRKYTELQC